MKRANPEPYVQKSFIVDPSDVKERPPERPAVTTWNYELVGARLVEAASTIRRMPMNTRPREFGGMWPAFNAMTPSELVSFENELLSYQLNRFLMPIGGDSDSEVVPAKLGGCTAFGKDTVSPARREALWLP